MKGLFFTLLPFLLLAACIVLAITLYRRRK